MDEDDPDLAAALRLSMGGGDAEVPGAKRPKSGSEDANGRPRGASADADAEMAAQLAKDDEKAVDVEFERFRGEDVLITEEAVKRINEYCEEVGEPYVDPQFPPVSRSLYIDEQDANTWQCMRCQARTPLPPVPQMPSTREEAMQLEASFEMVKCRACGEKAPYVVKSRYFNRPTQWLRPGVKCENCEATAPIEYPGLRDTTSLVEIMCTHFLRCKSTKKTLGQPWVLIRDKPRPEDVQQGALGNCWFAAALSIVAAKADLIMSLFVTKQYNRHGAYQLQLFHAGEWKGILIDDLFPTSEITPGKVMGEMVYYSQGGNLSFLSCARHQLWVPMVEKAAAKLFGSYGHLSSGTFGEALALFTGFPTERVVLYLHSEERARRAELRDRKIAARTEALLRGEQPEEDDDEDMLDEAFANDLLWSKLLSFREAGYLMGMGCTEQGCEKSKEHILEKGLQAPHAYGILDVREVSDASGTLHRLVQVRNPWGEDAPRTWKGDWGKDSPKWTFDMQLKLGVVNKSNVRMYDEMSIFWMSFEDVRNYFAVVEVCRVHEGWEETKERAWLPSGVGPGEAFDLTVYERTQVDLALWQEKHITRESALGASTNVDVGLAVLRWRQSSSGADSGPDFQCVEYVKRCSDDCASKEMILEGGYVYRLAPLCFNQMQQTAPRRVTLVVHSSNPVSLKKVSSTWRDLAAATVSVTVGKGRKGMVAPGVSSSMLSDAGYIFAVENDTDVPFGLQVDSSDSVGMVSSREGGACGCIDLVPPRSRKVVLALARRQGAVRMGWSFGFGQLPPEAAAWAVGAEDMHMSLPLPPQQAGTEPPDEAILKATPPARKARRLQERGGQTPSASASAAAGALPSSADEDAEAEAALAEALRLSLEGQPMAAAGAPGNYSEGGDDDDELAEAIRLSMAGSAPSTTSAPAPAAPSPAAPAAAAPAKPGLADMQRLVKELFEQFRQQGMPPNEAAVKAMQEAKARCGA
eukprot:TRINITY_DN21550_c0_g2_i1.p1 TRINITY_DN21550_c0_g2~~TRINITY_DN21550_c0_g2_i1.p1  ORF type:complete len:1109 (-),score=276.29 TRINITY_DN21550_c0_g2_i1:182-3118(-)